MDAKKKEKIITIFDSSFNKDGYISPEIYNKFLKLIIESVLLNKNLKLCMKHKYISFEKYIDSSNQVLIWDTLQSIGKNDPINGFGKLFLGKK